MQVFKRVVRFDKKVIGRAMLFFLPMLILAAFMLLYVLPMMQKKTIKEYEVYNQHLQNIVSGQFEQVDNIKKNIEKNSFVSKFLYVSNTQTYDDTSDITDLLYFMDELDNIDAINAITSGIGVYNKINNRIYYINGDYTPAWFFEQTYTIDKKSSGYWQAFFDKTQLDSQVQLLGPLEYTYYNLLYKDSTKEGFLYIAPINIGTSCELVFFSFIDNESLADAISVVPASGETYTFLYYNQEEISLNQETVSFEPYDISSIPVGQTIELDDYIVASSGETLWGKEFIIVTYISKKNAFNDTNTMKILIGVLLFVMFLYIYVFVYILNKRRDEIDQRKEKKLLINAFIRCCFNWNDESDLQRISEFYGSYYLFVATEKLNIPDCVETEGDYNFVIFTCEQNTIHIICSENDDMKAATAFLHKYIERQNIRHFGVSSFCSSEGIHDGYSQALDSYDNYSLSGEAGDEADTDYNSGLDNQILKYVNKNYEKPNLSLKDIADKFEINASNISRQFQQATGEHFRSYLMKLRINKACRLLTETENNVNTISQLSGYDNPDSFRRIFKQMTGQAPSDYRNNHIKNK